MDILELFPVMKLQDFHSFIDFYIKNASEVDEINIQIRNRIEPSGIWIEGVSNRKI